MSHIIDSIRVLNMEVKTGSDPVRIPRRVAKLNVHVHLMTTSQSSDRLERSSDCGPKLLRTPPPSQFPTIPNRLQVVREMVDGDAILRDCIKQNHEDYQITIHSLVQTSQQRRVGWRALHPLMSRVKVTAGFVSRKSEIEQYCWINAHASNPIEWP